MAVILASISLVSAFSGGNGSSSNPYRVATLTDLQNVDNSLSSYYIQVADINASETITWNGGAGFVPIGAYFFGNYNGNGYNITGLYINRPSTPSVGLFHSTDGATITNVTIINATVIGDYWSGGLVGYCYGGSNPGSGTGPDIVYNCRVINSSIGNPDTGALHSWAGGIAGRTASSDVYISECYSSGYVVASSNAGGIAGLSTAIISDCYSSAHVNGTNAIFSTIGGLVGDVNSGYVNNSYSYGLVESLGGAGGLIGTSSGTVTNSYYDVNTSGQTDNSGKGVPKTTSELQTQSTFTDWDFDYTWVMDGYPIFQLYASSYIIDPVIIYPENATEIDSDYPSLTDVMFEWTSNDVASSSSYQLARDSNYNTLVSSGTTTNNYKTLSLDADDYYFRVRYYYDTGVYSDWTETRFSINTTVSDYGTAIQGVVYESADGSYTALSSAKVTIYNDSWSDDYITGSNGYYLFENLAISDYYLTASKDGYETSSINIVNVTSATTYTKDIYLEEENAPTYITPHYVKFIVTDTSYTRYADASVTIYIGDSATAYKTLTTGADGACGAELSEDVEYHIVCVYEGQTVDFMLTPTDTVYRIYLDTSLLPDRDRLAIEEIQITVTPSEINSTHANVYVSYVDNMSETTSLYLFINDSDGGVLASGDIYPLTSYNFTIPDYQGEDYIVIVKSTHETFGTITRQYSIHFNDTSLDIGIWGTWIAAMCIMMIAMGAGKADADKAAGGILVIVFIFMAIGWLPHTLSFSTSYAVAFVLVVAWHMKNKDRSVSE